MRSLQASWWGLVSRSAGKAAAVLLSGLTRDREDGLSAENNPMRVVEGRRKGRISAELAISEKKVGLVSGGVLV